MIFQFVRRLENRALPRVGVPKNVEIKCKLNPIVRPKTLPQIRPDGARQPAVEARILSRALERALGLAPLTLPIIGR